MYIGISRYPYQRIQSDIKLISRQKTDNKKGLTTLLRVIKPLKNIMDTDYNLVIRIAKLYLQTISYDHRNVLQF